MSKKQIKTVLSIAVILITIVVFVMYFRSHPHTFSALKNVPVHTLILLFILYLAFIGTLAGIQQATLRLCGISLSTRESALVMMYSSIINFFGPLQSGPAFRAAYLKSRHNVNLKKYALATLLYYGLYAAISGLLILSFIIGWWIILGAIIGLLATPLALRIPRFRDLDLTGLRQLAIATLAQAAVQSLIYFVELHSILQHVTYIKALVYTGVANFALFVSVTPGAIGFRESFLVFSQKLHTIGNDTIAAASVIDRGVYIVMLLVMAALIFGLHANKLLKVKSAKQTAE